MKAKATASSELPITIVSYSIGTLLFFDLFQQIYNVQAGAIDLALAYVIVIYKARILAISYLLFVFC